MYNAGVETNDLPLAQGEFKTLRTSNDLQSVVPRANRILFSRLQYAGISPSNEHTVNACEPDSSGHVDTREC